MTDEQIIKAVDVCGEPDTCRGCPYHELYISGCVCALMKDVFDLINRQRAEIERLLQKLQQAKSKTIKEFAEELKESADNGGCGEDFVSVSDIDILVKEMTEQEC